ncbi:L-histidine N(alpha)-methyltransferase, partial [Klebsiella pneumoniae]
PLSAPAPRLPRADRRPARPRRPPPLGTDLIKDRVRLEAAYDDSAGITAEFNKNVLAVLNNQLGADFDLEAFEHVARYDDEAERMDIR